MIEYANHSGQIIAPSHDLTPNGGLVREITLFQGNLSWWNIVILPEPLPDNMTGCLGIDVLLTFYNSGMV